MGAVLAAAADADPTGGCAVFTDPARAQLAAAFDTPDCPAAILAWHARVTRPDDYRLSVRLVGDTTTIAPDRDSATVTGCALSWVSPLDGQQPDAGPPSPSRLTLHRVLDQGYQITDYQPC